MNVRYSKATREKVFALRAKGVTYENISKKTNVPVPTIGYWIRGTESKTTRTPIRPVTTENSKVRDNLVRTNDTIAALQEYAEFLTKELAR